MFQVETVNEAFLKVAQRGDAVAWLWRDASAGGTTDGSGEWKPITASQMYGRVRALAAALESWGVGKGDRVALISENRWEWPVTDFAVLALGAVDVPLYLTLTAEQVGYMLRDSGAKVAVVSNREQYEKILAAGDLPELERIVVMDGWEGPGPQQQTQIPFGNDKKDRKQVVSWMADIMANAEAMQARDAEFDARVREVRPEDLATIIYTSGTTGEPKGVMLTHGNLASNFSLSTKPFRFGETDVCVSFLPLSHVFERHVDYALMCDGATLAYCSRLDQLMATMKSVRPTIVVAVPRVYEKVRQGVEGKSHGIKKRILKWALAVGMSNREETLAGRKPRGLKWKLADKLVFAKIREALGGRVRTFISGGAPLGMDSGGWFADAGMRIYEGYGLTETSPVVSFNYPGSLRMGSIGRTLDNVEVRLAGDGEIEVKGPNVFGGYWNKPKETAEAFSADGWFRTGDIGKADSDGFYSITDRKKEILKTSGGKMIAPAPIENRLKADALVGNAALTGDTHKFVCVLLSPNFAALEDWAKVHGVTAADRGALVKDAQVLARYRKIVDDVNATLAPFESIKRLALVPDEWSVETDELTPSMKLKRRVVEKKYAAEIAGFYHDEATASR